MNAVNALCSTRLSLLHDLTTRSIRMRKNKDIHTLGDWHHFQEWRTGFDCCIPRSGAVHLGHLEEVPPDTVQLNSYTVCSLTRLKHGPWMLGSALFKSLENIRCNNWSASLFIDNCGLSSASRAVNFISKQNLVCNTWFTENHHFE